MATIYKTEIKMVSPFCAYTEEDMEKILNTLIKSYKNNSGLGFESIDIKVQTCNPITSINEAVGEKDNFFISLIKKFF